MPTTSLRTRPTAQTARAAQQLAGPLGITELTDLTALDRLVLPVFIATRPQAALQPVAAGKGRLEADAQAGALMEAVEYAVAEHDGLAADDDSRTLAELQAHWPEGLALQHFAPQVGPPPAPDTTVPVVRCQQLGSRRRVWLPAELVRLPCRLPAGVPALFGGGSSNGLASGNSLDEATLHALLEVLERDAVAMNMAHDRSCLVQHDDLPAPWAEQASAWRQRGVTLAVRWLPSVVGLPCFAAALIEPGARPDVRLARGWGLHLDRDIALSRAICEAAQVRLLTLTQARPAAAPAAGAPPELDEVTLALRERLALRAADATHSVRYAELPHRPMASVRGALRAVRTLLAQHGLGPVFRHRLAWPPQARPLSDLEVVKVVVAGCESANGGAVRMGPRLQALLWPQA